MRVQAPRSYKTLTPDNSQTACAGWVEAFTYNTGASAVVIFCSDSKSAALNSHKEVSFEKNRMKPSTPSTDIFGINLVAATLSYKIAHEMMHATDLIQCKFAWSYN